MVSQAYNIIIEHVVSVPGHGREVVNALNVTEKRFILRWMEAVELPGSNGYDTHIEIHYVTQKDDVIL